MANQIAKRDANFRPAMIGQDENTGEIRAIKTNSNGELLVTGSATIADDTSIQKIIVSKNGTPVGTREQVNLIEGSNVTLTITDNSIDNRVDVEIEASGGGGGGDVTGPASSTQDAIARYDDTTGKVIDNSLVTISDAGVVSGATQLNVDNLRLDGNTLSSTNTNGDLNLTPDGTGNVVQATVKASGSAGVDIKNSTGTSVIVAGAGGGTGTSIAGTTNVGNASDDYFQMAGGTGTISNTATGSSTNININLVPKGIGRIQAGGVSVPTISSSDTLTNKTISADDNTISGIAASSFVLSNGSGNIDGSASQKAIPSGTVVGTSDAQTLTTKRIQPRSVTAASGDISPDLGSYNVYQRTAISAGITINAPTGTPVLGEVIVLMLKDNGTSRSLTWNSTYTTVPMAAALPTATTISKQLLVTCQYDGTQWLCLSASQT